MIPLQRIPAYRKNKPQFPDWEQRAGVVLGFKPRKKTSTTIAELKRAYDKIHREEQASSFLLSTRYYLIYFIR